MRYSRSIFAALAILAVTSRGGRAEDALVEIPLKEIWALRMPNTRDICELPTARADQKIVQSIREALLPAPNAKQGPRGFAVIGVADDALSHVHDILVGKAKPTVRFSTGDEITIVFFSYQSPFYVHLDKVERKSNAIRISYSFVPHQSAETTDHFALIPMGKLPPGNYGVRIEPSPMPKNLLALGYQPPAAADVPKIVSQSFLFVVAAE